MEGKSDPASRDRALRVVRWATIGGAGGALGLAGAFSTAAAITFSGKQPPAPKLPPPQVPVAAAPVQKAPPAPLVVTRFVHHPAPVRGGRRAVPAAPGRPPAAVPGGPPPAPGAGPPPPPPPPPCHSTPSHPC